MSRAAVADDAHGRPTTTGTAAGGERGAMAWGDIPGAACVVGTAIPGRCGYVAMSGVVTCGHPVPGTCVRRPHSPWVTSLLA